MPYGAFSPGLPRQGPRRHAIQTASIDAAPAPSRFTKATPTRAVRQRDRAGADRQQLDLVGSGSMALPGGGTSTSRSTPARSCGKTRSEPSASTAPRPTRPLGGGSTAPTPQTTGTHVDVANPGFPVTATTLRRRTTGFASYWGINFQGLDLNSIADAQPIPSLTVTGTSGQATRQPITCRRSAAS